MKYYPINEDLARRANEMNSFFEYVPGRATQSYRAEVDEAAALAERQKQRVDPMYHEKINGLLDAFARKLADNINRRNEIATRVPSILVAGGSNFPVRKKEKQNQADAAAMEEYRQIRSLLDKIRGTGRGGISADDPAAVDKLKAKLAGLERDQEKMKTVNAYHRKHKTLEGCPRLTQDEIETLNASMARDWRSEPKPYPSFRLTNNNAVIRQTKKRIEELSAKAEMEYEGWKFDGGEVKVDREINRLQVFFDAKPDRETCSAMRHEGFRWAPSVGAWQRQLNDNAIRAAKGLDFLQPLAAEQPTQAEPVQESPKPDAGWRFYIIADLKTWAENGENRSPLEHFDSFEAAKARFEELRGMPYNSETVDPGPDGQPPARLTLGLESADGMSAADILHVRQGQNYLVTDFVRMERLRDDPQAMDVLARASREIGFDLVRVHEQTGEKTWTSTVVSFAEWDNPYFPAAAPGSIAARYHDLLRQCYPLPKDDALRKAQVEEVTRYILDDGRSGAIQLSLVIDGVAASCPNNADVQKLEELKSGVTYDQLSITGVSAPWPEVLAVYAVKTTSDPTNGQEVVTMDDGKKDLLKLVFWDMNEVSSFTSTVPGEGDEEDTTTLHITVTAKTADEMADVYGFNASQRQQLAELLSDEYRELWNSVLYGIGTGSDEIVAVALSQVGNVGGQPYWSWYGFSHRVDWCAIFVSWCANECGYIEAGAIPKFAGCVQGSRWFKNRGLWQDRNYEPQLGDVVFFDWHDPDGFSGPQDGVPDHVGIVEKVENGRVYTVEGNSGDKCCQRSYPIGYYEIYGYGLLCS